MSESNLLGIFIALSVSIFVMLIAKYENKIVQKILHWLPAILLTFLIPGVLSFFFDLSLENIVLHDWSKAYIYPITIFCIMSSMSLAQLKIVGLKPLILFLIGSFTIAVIPALLFMLYYLGNEQMADLWKGIIPIVGSWIGGSSSMLVLKEYVAVREDLFLSVLLLDNMIQNIVMIFLFQIIRRTDEYNQKFNISQPISFSEKEQNQNRIQKNPYLSVLIAVGLTALVVAMEFSFITNVIILSITGLVVGNVFRFWSFDINLKIGSVGIILIMSILGLKLKFNDFELPMILILFMINWMIINIAVIAFFNYKLKISMAWGPIAMMANIGGISTSPALASAYDKRLMPHAVVLAIVSMATGTFWGFLTTLLIESQL
ncbi:MAG: Uncharacterised protein [Flavobacteriaceae bacterium]|nr:MAG: Uncharacterised protein [Flavobacteriaceae bacterium]